MLLTNSLDIATVYNIDDSSKTLNHKLLKGLPYFKGLGLGCKIQDIFSQLFISTHRFSY
jgi:hypothetical protein